MSVTEKNHIVLHTSGLLLMYEPLHEHLPSIKILTLFLCLQVFRKNKRFTKKKINFQTDGCVWLYM